MRTQRISLKSLFNVNCSVPACCVLLYNLCALMARMNDFEAFDKCFYDLKVGVLDFLQAASVSSPT